MRLRNIGVALAGATLLALPISVWAADQQENDMIAVEAQSGEPSAPLIVQDYEPNPAIWLLSDEDTKIYLFGTFHILPPGLEWRTAQFDAIVQEAEELVVESSDEELSDDAFETEFLQMFMDMSKRTPTSQRLSPEAAEKWRTLAELAELPFWYFDSLPPMMAVMTMGVGFALDAGSTTEAGVETILEAEFAEAGKPIGSIEDPLPVFRNVMAIDEDMLIAQLEEDLANWDGQSLDTIFTEDGEPVDDDVFAMEHAWARGDETSVEMFGDTPFEKAMQKVLLTDRNRAWALWLDERLDSPGTVLVAVGSGHFEGSDSVQNMLAERGLTANRIN